MWKWITAKPGRFLLACFVVAVGGMAVLGMVTTHLALEQSQSQPARTYMWPDGTRKDTPPPLSAEQQAEMAKHAEVLAAAKNKAARAAVKKKAEAAASAQRQVEAFGLCERALRAKYRVAINVSVWNSNYGKTGNRDSISGETELPNGRLVSFQCIWASGKLIEAIAG